MKTRGISAASQAKSKGGNVLDGGEGIFNIFGSTREQGMLEDWRSSVWLEQSEKVESYGE